MDETLTLAFQVTFTHVGLVAATAPALLVAWLGYRRSKATDLQAAQAGVAVQHTVTTGQVLDSLDKLVQRLSADNDTLRSEAMKMNATLTAQNERIDTQNMLIEQLRTEVASLRLNNGINGMEGAKK